MSLALGPIKGRPIRVVLFGGGPGLERGIGQFLCRLEDDSEIELAGAFFQSPGESVAAVLGDLWRRRRWLAPGGRRDDRQPQRRHPHPRGLR